jgi:uncharacterized membrane protein YeiB
MRLILIPLCLSLVGFMVCLFMTRDKKLFTPWNAAILLVAVTLTLVMALVMLVVINY